MKLNQDCADFDVHYAEAVGRDIIGPLAEHYFRLKVVGLENIPTPDENSPVIFLANHAGRCLPWDAMLLDFALSRHWVDEFGVSPEDKPRPLAAPQLSTHPLLIPFRLKRWWHKVGCIDATARNFQRLLKEGKSVIIFPEGIPGIAREFRERYQLLPFSTSVVRMAARYNARLVFVSIVGSEYFHPYANRSRLTDAIARRLRLPFLHLSPFTFLLPFCPWSFYMALPAPITLVVGAPYTLNEQTIVDEAQWAEATEELREECQRQLSEARTTYERTWNWLELVKTLWAAPEPFWKLLPFAWPHLFINHARQQAPDLFPDALSPWRFLVPLLGWLPPRSKKPTPEEVLRPTIPVPARQPALTPLSS